MVRERLLSFSYDLSAAARTAGYAPRAAADAWYASASNDPNFARLVAPWKGRPLRKAPFQLLAIVNRMDLASWNGESHSGAPAQWTGGEVRFVYGVSPAGGSDDLPPFTLILEFRLPPRGWPEFQSLARSWQRVSQVSSKNTLAALSAALMRAAIERLHWFGCASTDRLTAASGGSSNGSLTRKPASFLSRTSMIRSPKSILTLPPGQHPI